LDKTPIKTLNLSKNKIGDKAAEYLAEVLKVKRTLIQLYLNDNQISNRGVQFLANALCHPKANLLKLYLHNNPLINDLSVDYLVEMLRQNRSLNTLWLINCNLTDAGRQRLRERAALKKNFYLNMERFD
jgi:Ran GTPase-activating protein (RanGAP) involved in mRNA processing and transport